MMSARRIDSAAQRSKTAVIVLLLLRVSAASSRSGPAATPRIFVTRQPFTGAIPPAPDNEFVRMALDARTPDNRVIVTYGSHQSILTQLPLLLHSMRAADRADMTRHFVVVTMGLHALDACQRLHKLCVSDSWETSLLNAKERERAAARPNRAPQLRNASWEVRQREVEYGSPVYRDIIWRKDEVVRDVLFAGADVLFMDLDIVVFRNVLSDDVLDYGGGADILIQKEHHPTVDALSNVGFYFMRSTPATKALMMDWLHEESRMYFSQFAFNLILSQEGYRPELRWQHISPFAGVNACILRGDFGDIHSFADLKSSTARMVDSRKFRGLTFFHAACWKDEMNVSKPEALHFILNYYLQHTSGFGAAGRPAPGPDSSITTER